MNSLKIIKREPSAANRRKTDNSMAKRKRTNNKKMLYKTLDGKLKMQHVPCCNVDTMLSIVIYQFRLNAKGVQLS